MLRVASGNENTTNGFEGQLERGHKKRGKKQKEEPEKSRRAGEREREGGGMKKGPDENGRTAVDCHTDKSSALIQ